MPLPSFACATSGSHPKAAAALSSECAAPHLGTAGRHPGRALSLALIGLLDRFGLVVALVVVWGLLWATLGPIRQAYLNEQIPSRQRATILSFDSLMGSSGGVVIQPALGRAADVWSYGTSYLWGAAVNALALPFIALARRESVPADSACGPPGAC